MHLSGLAFGSGMAGDGQGSEHGAAAGNGGCHGKRWQIELMH